MEPFGQLASGTTLEVVMAEMCANPNGVLKGLIWVAGAGGALPVDLSGAITELAPGKYVAFCFIPTRPMGQATRHEGMLKEIVVAGTPNGAVAAQPPISRSTWATSPSPTTPHRRHPHHQGDQRLRVNARNCATRLDDGATAESFLGAFAPGVKGPPPGKPVWR
ncbi:MAG: hypothetical protein IPO52_04075 [Gemmatimonadetes bacterium]|nr:hypothetical protein [Gemmatimonadota bacterium]